MNRFSQYLRAAPVTAWSLLAVAANAVVGVIIARQLVPGDRGFVAVAISTAGLVSVVAALGTNVTLRAQLPRNAAVNLSGYRKLSVLLLLVVAVPLLAITALVTAKLVDGRLASTAGIAGFVAFGVSSFLWFQTREALAATGAITIGAAINAAGSFALLLAVVGMALWSEVATYGVITCYVGATALQFVGAYWWLSREDFGVTAKGGSILLRQGPRMLGYHFGQDLVFQFDRYLLGALGTTASVGYYVVAATPAELLRIPTRSAGQYVLLDAARGSFAASRVWRNVAGWTVMTALAVPIGWALAPWIIELVYGEEYLGAVTPLRLLLIAQVLLVPYLLCSRGLVGLGATWSASSPGVAGIIALVISAVILVPMHGAAGAAVSAGAAYMAMSVAAILGLRRRIRLLASRPL